MLSGFKNVFVGVSAFAVGLIYFYGLALSVISVWSGYIPWYIVLAAWTLVSAVLYEEKEYSQITQAIRGAFDRRPPG